MSAVVDEQLVDELLESYVTWREECAHVRATYRLWSTAPGVRSSDAFQRYLDASDREEAAANRYAEMVGRVSENAQGGPQPYSARRRVRSMRF